KIAERNQLTIETEPPLIEIKFGIYEGEPIETTAFQENRSEISLPFPEGESVVDVAGRIYPLIEEGLASEETYQFVCHNAV
ncbi:histidine phosphatase family protein, partial [Enterococcus faecalis]|uniref:histidine phosphatase family protein n=1 Tax=Enterococcus faecalis TaxID=1351 RepID=UPI003CC5A61A